MTSSKDVALKFHYGYEGTIQEIYLSFDYIVKYGVPKDEKGKPFVQAGDEVYIWKDHYWQPL